MKKIIFATLILLFISDFSFGQTKSNLPSLSKLVTWVNLPYSKFDLDARTFGFGFEEKQSNEKSTDYVYLRKFNKGGYVYTERLKYKIWTSDNSTVIEFDATQDLISFYATQYEEKKFATVECSEKTKDNQTSFCYSNKTYFLRITDTRREYNAGSGNEYTISIAKI